MKAIRLAFASGVLLLCGTPQVASQILLPPESSWQYTFAEPGSGWQTGALGGVSWLTGNSPFSNCGPLGGFDCTGQGSPDPFNANTIWPADESGSLDDDLWVRTQLDLSGQDVSSLQLRWGLGVDNGYKLYFNGVLLSQGSAEGFTSRWEYTGTVPTALLSPTSNWIAVALEDRGVLTAFDMAVVAGTQALPPPIPEHETYALMLAGLAAVGVMVRRKRSRG